MSRAVISVLGKGKQALPVLTRKLGRERGSGRDRGPWETHYESEGLSSEGGERKRERNVSPPS